MWHYQYTDELYHYGIPGMRWGHRKYNYGSMGANLAARIRRKQLMDTRNRISGDSKTLKKMEKNYEWQRKNHSDLKRSGSRIANSRILTGIRKNRMNKLNKKIKTMRDSIKEDHDIVNELNKYESNARKKANNISRTKAAMQKAKIAKKRANKQYSKDYDKAYAYSSRHMISQYGKGKHGQESTARWKKVSDSIGNLRSANDNYKKAKKAYKKARKS